MTQTQGFDLDKMATAVRGRAGAVRVVHEGWLDWEVPLAQLQATTGAKGKEAGTLKQVLDASGVTRKIEEQEEQRKAQGYTLPDGYLISIVQENGRASIQNMNLDDALEQVVHDGDVVSITGRLSGR